MQLVATITDLEKALAHRRRIALVPTMGNLHAGHLSLIQIARSRGDIVVASVFVNPLQFAPTEDFASYPRTLDRDCQLLATAGCDIVFAPSEREMYPVAQTYTVRPPANLADILEGNVRPGFFTGVCTVVLKLFNIVRPDIAVFGKKDYQQLLVIRNMVQQFNLPIDVVAGGTVRSPTGLALSSRNGYLNDLELQEAGHLNAALRETSEQVRAGRTDWSMLERGAIQRLTQRGWSPDYIAIRRQANLDEPAADEPLVVLGAARLGGTRLIDNIELALGT
jgi:pantoate--beta-alanine ligase